MARIAIESFERAFGRDVPELAVRVPGRVNLIGEHTDYNDGLVLPIAIPLRAVLLARRRGDERVRLRSEAMRETAEFDLRRRPREVDPPWARYAAGVLAILAECGLSPVGLDAAFGGDLPVGAGLSSSAALVVAVALARVALADRAGEGVPAALREIRFLAEACREAERRAAGVRCGIMDPYVALAARQGEALFLDCRSLEARGVPFPGEKAALVLADTGVRHALASGEYEARRLQCEEVVERSRAKGIGSLRDLDREALERLGSALPPVLFARARHVVSENDRVKGAVQALERGNLRRLGELLGESHASLRDDYEVSCAELDALVEIARSVPGVFGSRMTGGGFGGSTVTLLERGREDALREAIEREYPKRTGRRAAVRPVEAVGGATVESLG